MFIPANASLTAFLIHITRRLYTRNSVEERLLQLCEKRRGLEQLFQPGPTRNTSTGCKLLEDVLKWGTQQLFRGAAGAWPDGEGAGEGGPQPMDTEGSGKRQDKAAYTPEQVQEVVGLGAAACSGGEAAAAGGEGEGQEAEGGAAPLGPGLELVVVRTWPDLDKTLDDATTVTGGLSC